MTNNDVASFERISVPADGAGIRAVVTGATRGIGRAIVESIAPQCSYLCGVASSRSRLESLESQLRQVHPELRSRMVAVDLGAGEQAAEVVADAVFEDSGSIDFLVLDAGVFVEGGLTRISPDEYARAMAVNVDANVYLCQKLVPALRKGAKPRILIVGSTAGLEAYPPGPSYGVAKWALRGLAINLRHELMDDRVGVTLLSPGATLTDMWEGEEVDAGRLLAPQDVATMASAILKLSEQAVVEEIRIRPMLPGVRRAAAPDRL